LDIIYQTVKDMKSFIADFEKNGMSVYEDIK